MPSKPWSSNFFTSRLSDSEPSLPMANAQTLRCTLSLTYSVLPSGLTSMPLVVPMFVGGERDLALACRCARPGRCSCPSSGRWRRACRPGRWPGRSAGSSCRSWAKTVIFFVFGSMLEDVVADVIGDVHHALAVEDDAVADALAGQLDPDLALAVGRDLADGLLLLEVDDVDVALRVAGGALDAGREAFSSVSGLATKRVSFSSARPVASRGSGRRR